MGRRIQRTRKESSKDLQAWCSSDVDYNPDRGCFHGTFATSDVVRRHVADTGHAVVVEQVVTFAYGLSGDDA